MNEGITKQLDTLAPHCQVKYKGTMIHVRPIRVWCRKRSPPQIMYIHDQYQMLTHFTNVNEIYGIKVQVKTVAY